MRKKLKSVFAVILAASLCFSVFAGAAEETEGADGGAGLYQAGTYTGVAEGKNGDVTVEVTFSDDAIESVTVTDHQETDGVADPALEQIPDAIVESQSLAVDAASGATVTSEAILAAVEDCVMQAGADPELLMVAEEEGEADAAEKTEETVTTDVLVVGSGISGLTAAISAAENGEDVIVIEKQATLGGTTAIAGGYLICIDPEENATEGVDTSLDTFRDYWEMRMSYSGADSGYPDWDRWEYIVEQTGTTVDWLSDKGVRWESTAAEYFGPYPAVHDVDGGAGLVQDLVDIAENEGVQIITECTGEELVQDDSGAVVGIIAETDDEVITYEASAVILATGGISQNDELVAEYSPKVANAGTVSNAASGSTGDGLVMALDVGAATFDEFFTSIQATTVDPEILTAVPDMSALISAVGTQLGVNANGERFGNEAPAVYDGVGSDQIQDGNAPFYYIFDSSDDEVTPVLEEAAEAGCIAKADSIAELADEMGVDADTLQATYDRYAELVEAGEDEDQGKDAEYLIALDTAPFFAVRYFPTTFGSQGGVQTDYDGRVLNEDGEVIPGLYAAGEMSNRYYYNENYVLAASLGLYAVSGSLAGSAAAADIG